MKPEYVIDTDGTKRWYLNGLLYREDGPAVEYANGNKSWYINGEYHREDGPAIEYADGEKKWWLNDEEYTKKEYYKELYKLGKITKDELFLELL